MDLPSSSAPLLVPSEARGPRRALVLGGGGSTGNAWLIGVLAGLDAAGLDVASADLVIGTSAGATAGAQLAGATPSDLLEAILTAPTQPLPSGPRHPPTPGAASQQVTAQLERMQRLIDGSADATDMRRRLGASALDRLAAADGSWQDRWRSIVASRLPVLDWPARPLLFTAVDAGTGDPVTLDQHSGADLVDAVAASTSSGLPYSVGDRWLIDGGFRRNENADLATGFDRVLVLAPFSGKSLTPPEWGLQLDAQLEELRTTGSTVETIFPGAELDHLFGANAMDLSLRPSAARAGFARGQRYAEEAAAIWV
ncbi:patatin-like phospholipase family protein [Pseudoclavibacter sp. 8L]|uniref:patatin-like phospholipase family protein n=1 Tax=Pseudoclavibacter sp. 8L TaxID=2653162 RepID=UPI0012F125AD|nr:patatin-like phospholipase family protein [Pseudoclavibacter sp. 8L]VXA95663.1 Patatin [Pseudoclavibacter sp. 8L]